MTLSDRKLELQGSSATTGTVGNNFNDVIDLNNGAVLQLDAGATFNDTTISGGGNALLIQSTAGTAGTVTNLGTWEKTGNSSGNDTISVAFSTTNGTVSVQAGTLNLSGGGTDSGATYSGAGTIDFGGGTRTLDATSSITANALFSGSETTTVNGTYNAASTDVSGGTASLAGTVTGLGATTISGGTLNLNGASTTATSLTESSGTLSGTGTLTVSGATSFSGNSTESGSGTAATVADGGANFASGTTLTLSDRKLELQGSSATTGTVGNNFNDVIDLNNGAVLQLDAGAIFNDTTISGGGNALLIQSTAGTAGTVTNLGTWEKTGNSSGNDTISVAFSTTNGTVSVQAGTLNLSGGGTDTGATYSGAGTIDFGGGTRTLDATSSITANALFSGSETTTVNGTYNAASTAVSGGTASLAGTVTGLGATTISGGTLNLNGASTTATSLTESGGTLTGTGTLTVSGAATFSGASTESGSGTAATVADGGANFASGTTLTLSARKLELQGSSATTGTVGNNFNDVIDLNNGAVLQLDASATFNDTTISGGGNALLIQSTAGTAGTVTNLGTWEKTGNSSGNDTISVAFSTTNGTVSVQAGTLNLSGGGTDSGATYSGAGTIDFGGGTRTLDATSSITTNALFSGSETTTVNGTYNAASTAVSGGTASLAGTVTGLGAATISGGTLNLNGASTTATSLTESSGTLSGTGTLTVSGATSFSGNSTESGSGTAATVADGGANFASGTTLTLSDRKLELQGSSATTGTVGNNFNDVIDLNNGAVLQLDAGAIFNDTTISGGGNALLIQSTAGTAGTVTNLGTWEKTGNSSGNDTISVAFSTTNGTVSVQAGTLNLSGGGTDTGATYSGAGTIDFGGGTRTLDATSSITANALFSGSETTTVNGTLQCSEH